MLEKDCADGTSRYLPQVDKTRRFRGFQSLKVFLTDGILFDELDTVSQLKCERIDDSPTVAQS